MASKGGIISGKEGFKEKVKGGSRNNFKGLENSSQMIDSVVGKEAQTGIGFEDGNLLQKSVLLGVDAGIRGNGMGKGFPRLTNRVTINLSMKSVREIKELRAQLESELFEIRSLLKKINDTEGQKAGSSSGKLKRVHSGDAAFASRPLNQLNVPMLVNSPVQGGSVNAGKQKRVQNVNQGLKPNEKHQGPEAKRLKTSGKKGQRGESAQPGVLRNFPNNFVKSCGSLLDRLVKHKHGWVFNKPVDPVALKLHDYFDIIKTPMDLNTIKSRLSTNWYKSPQDFAEDVRLTFRNALTYNPIGHDVHTMAEILLKIFEEKWVVIEADYNRLVNSQLDLGDGLPLPNNKKAPPARIPPPEAIRELNRPVPIPQEVDPRPKAMNSAPVRGAVLKKPKAREPNKREMTYGEKQKLSENLQSLPSEKLEMIVQIIKKRNLSLCQSEDEVEVDIDNVDTETLWELDRFVINYRKNLAKFRKQAEAATQSTGAGEPSIGQKDPENFVPTSVFASNDVVMDAVPQSFKEKQTDNVTKSTKAGNGSPDLVSSSDSDSQSVSDIGSDI